MASLFFPHVPKNCTIPKKLLRPFRVVGSWRSSIACIFFCTGLTRFLISNYSITGEKMHLDTMSFFCLRFTTLVLNLPRVLSKDLPTVILSSVYCHAIPHLNGKIDILLYQLDESSKSVYMIGQTSGMVGF